jgi:hypothetical protein
LNDKDSDDDDDDEYRYIIKKMNINETYTKPIS